MINEADTYCGKCIKADVCGMEGIYDPAMTFCAYRVEGYTPEQVQDLIALNKKLSEERQRGEWIDVNGDGSIMKCSKCGEEVCCKNNNFCSNCGADMRTKEREPKKPCPCDTCGCMIDRTGCQMDLCSDYQKWKEGEADDDA